MHKDLMLSVSKDVDLYVIYIYWLRIGIYHLYFCQTVPAFSHLIVINVAA